MCLQGTWSTNSFDGVTTMEVHAEPGRQHSSVRLLKARRVTFQKAPFRMKWKMKNLWSVRKPGLVSRTNERKIFAGVACFLPEKTKHMSLLGWNSSTGSWNWRGKNRTLPIINIRELMYLQYRLLPLGTTQCYFYMCIIPAVLWSNMYNSICSAVI